MLRAMQPRRLGAYQLDRLLGQGGMGAVYAGRHVTTGHAVAIKTVRLERHSEDLAARFAREAELAARLRHPHVVPVHDLGCEGGEAFIVMDLVEGESLAARLRRAGPLAPREAVEEVLALCEGLAHAHARGVLHRDLKPDNVLLAPDGRPLLTDFGLAREVVAARERLTRTGQILGTPGFMPPEQVRGDGEVGPAADVWGLGATLYALLAGQPPFRRASTLATLSAILHEAPAPLRRLRPEVDAGLEAVCLRCLARPAEERYPSAGALADDLRRWLEGDAVSGLRLSAFERARVWAARRRRVIAAATLGAALAVSSWGVATRVGLGAAAPPIDREPPHLAVAPLPTSTALAALPLSSEAAGASTVTVRGPAGEARAQRVGSRFTAQVPLALGRNALEVVARDPAGNEARATLTVTREPEWLASWLAALPAADRPPCPLPAPIEPTAAPGVFRAATDGSELIWHPRGTFLMGARTEFVAMAQVADVGDMSHHPVTLTRGFFLGRHEVTWAQLDRFAAATGARIPSRTITPEEYAAAVGPAYAHEHLLAEPFTAPDDHPAFRVTLAEALAYCAWAGLRLPTEAEWEYAAAGVGAPADAPRFPYPWPVGMAGEAPCNVLGMRDGWPLTCPVGSFPADANPLGALGFAGNVCEWTSDRYVPYPAGPRVDPKFEAGDPRVVTRGSDWRRLLHRATLTSRHERGPNERDPGLGFRVAF